MAARFQSNNTISKFNKDDYLLIQNDVNLVDKIIDIAHEKGLKIIFNPAPFNENIHNLKIPTLVLHGANDKIVPIKVNDKISQLDNVKFLKVENSKHEILNQDTRMFVLSEIHHWFKEQNIL